MRQALLGKDKAGLSSDKRYLKELASAVETGEWGVLDGFSDGGADDAGTPYATAEYGWVVGGTHELALERWSEGGSPMRGLPEDMDSNRAELYGALAILEETKEWEGVLRLWIGNSNVGDGLKRLLGVVPMSDVRRWDAGATMDEIKEEAACMDGAGRGSRSVGGGSADARPPEGGGGGEVGAWARGW